VTTDPNRTAVERSLRRRRFALFLSSPLFAILLAVASSHELISDTTLRVSLFAYVALATAVYLVLVLNARKKLRVFIPDFTKPPDDIEKERLRRIIRSLKRPSPFMLWLSFLEFG
jgi:hypothetical protein